MTSLPAPAKILDGRENGLTESGKVVVVADAPIELDNYFYGYHLQDLPDHRLQPTSSIRSDKKQMILDPPNKRDRGEAHAGILILDIPWTVSRKRSEIIA